ncbi:hypothetical protein NEOC95_001496 [Neochlamydia sp. AcF95]|nr:hypothetical protein [Neochlamydia sp. AcF95]
MGGGEPIFSSALEPPTEDKTQVLALIHLKEILINILFGLKIKLLAITICGRYSYYLFNKVN